MGVLCRHQWLSAPLLAAAILFAPVSAYAVLLSCSQPGGPTANAFLVCIGNPCVVSQDFNAPDGCELDFGNRTVVFKGTFTVGGRTLIVHAGTIQVEGKLSARSDDNTPGGRVSLTADDGIVVKGRIDASGSAAGTIRLTAGGTLDLQSLGTLVAIGVQRDTSINTASGGTIIASAGTSLTDNAIVTVGSGPGGQGGTVTFLAQTNVTIATAIDATGGVNDGGDIDVLAGDDISVQRTLDVSSTTGGGGGTITVRAGLDGLGGVAPGGRLDVSGNLAADGGSDIESGFDGGEITLATFGPITVAATSTIRATGGNPDGTGGSLDIDSSDFLINGLTPLDGDLTMAGTVVMRATGIDSGGGEIDLAAGRDLFINGSMDASAGSGGSIGATAGRSLQVNAVITAGASVDSGDGGDFALQAGFADFGTLTIARNLIGASGASGAGEGMQINGCTVVVQPNVILDARGGTKGTGRLDIASPGGINLGGASRYLATPTGEIVLTHPLAFAPVIGTGVVANPPFTDHPTDTSIMYPPCPVCGDGVRQPGETCDKGAAADGACCNATCTAFVCPTASPTGPTPTSPQTPTPTRTLTPMRTPTPTPTFTPDASQPTPTPMLPLAEPNPVLMCERAFGRSTSTLALTDLSVLEACSVLAFQCVEHQPAGPERDECLVTAAARCARKRATLDGARAKFGDALDSACGGEPPRVPLLLLRASSVLAFETIEPVCQDEIGLTLDSIAAISACVQIGGACRAEGALAMAVPRIGDLLSLLFDAEHSGLCLPPATGNTEGLVAAEQIGPAIACQKIAAVATRKLIQRRIGVGRKCTDALLKCRLTGRPCQKAADQCAERLGSLTNGPKAAGATLFAALQRKCGGLPTEAFLGPAGVGFAATAARCVAVGVPALTDTADVATCVTRAAQCGASAILRHALPIIDDELARYGLLLDDGPFCLPPTPTPTPIDTPTPTPG